MNKYLYMFIDDELKNNSYYKTIRKYAKGKSWNDEVVEPIAKQYYWLVDRFAPYKFMDGVNDYLEALYKQKSDELNNNLYDIIDYALENNYFVNY